MKENQSQITHLNTYKDQITQTKEGDNVTTKTLHLDDLFFNDPSIMTEWTDMDRQSIWKEILLNKERMNSEGEAYYLYERSPQNERENED